jgi:hypothetical protein
MSKGILGAGASEPAGRSSASAAHMLGRGEALRRLAVTSVMFTCHSHVGDLLSHNIPFLSCPHQLCYYQSSAFTSTFSLDTSLQMLSRPPRTSR